MELTDAGRAAVRRWQAGNTEILTAARERLHPAWQHLIAAALPALEELVDAIDACAEDPSTAAAG
ncbi:hypothetical protein [Amycolatopsis nalaikhensis]|uniref:MarR family transcriptional regulator n=1 Tax=Amycolatopsis nalaikhensis TaxID=715472 RepID=A0ABY8Y481_9PSEU|nr:hypothetical protein [Amycolatopsis sp. 2-2]WIV62350.1 hypothetical protein QP939_11835 [Amycolatopsis sp. 2-2]